MTPYVQLENVTVARGGVPMINDVSVSFSEQRIGVIGANGSGKSTLLRAIIGLDTPVSGTVTYEFNSDQKKAPDQANYSRTREPWWRFGRARHESGNATPTAAPVHGIGFLFAEPDSQLLMPTVGEDIALSLDTAIRLGAIPQHSEPLRRGGSGSLPRGVAQHSNSTAARVTSFLESLGWNIDPSRAISTLSSGEKQLVALASVLALSPSVILCDEPATRLDRVWHARIIDELLSSPQRLIIATHDLELAGRMDRVIVVDRGSITFDGEPRSAIEYYVATVDHSVKESL